MHKATQTAQTWTCASWNVVQQRESADVCSYMRAPSVIGQHREQRGGPVLSVVAVSSPVLEN